LSYYLSGEIVIASFGGSEKDYKIEILGFSIILCFEHWGAGNAGQGFL
jgi:hypothetical protein